MWAALEAILAVIGAITIVGIAYIFFLFRVRAKAHEIDEELMDDATVTRVLSDQRGRAADLSKRERMPVFRLGQRVYQPAHARYGRIDAIYADVQSAIDADVIPAEWLELQAIRPLTVAASTWYSLVLESDEGGAALAGEADLVPG